MSQAFDEVDDDNPAAPFKVEDVLGHDDVCQRVFRHFFRVLRVSSVVSS
jgi:hypothetical protein